VKASHSEMTRALDAPQGKIKLYLLHGADESGSNALAKRLERALGSEAERIDMTSAALKDDPALLADEAASFSLFGTRRFMRLQPATEDAVPAIEAMLATDTAENPIVAIAGALKPTSALLKLALARADILSFASYVPDGADAEALATSLGRDVGLRLSRDVARRIAGAAANDRAVMAQELEKIALYLDAAIDRPTDATLEAVEAIGATLNDSAFSELTESVLGGKPDRAARAMARLTQDGIAGVAMLRILQKRVVLLSELRAEVEEGSTPDAAVRARGKAIFFKEVASLTHQLSIWPAAQLSTAAARLLQVERAIKSAGNAGDVVCAAELIQISRAAARLRT
jgi:DNA polymerase III subunit delta